ncbi:hypothetical protein [Flagellimonas sp. MMG031]|uniref:Uncharacterized protein n=1 Tax=Flagellimonas sp. MMG031 TaxID=3158549 RepID=A0AAU7MW31_9FLAO
MNKEIKTNLSYDNLGYSIDNPNSGCYMPQNNKDIEASFSNCGLWLLSPIVSVRKVGYEDDGLTLESLKRSQEAQCNHLDNLQELEIKHENI